MSRVLPFFLLFLVPILAQAQSGVPAKGLSLLPFKAVEKSFPNGLQVIVVPTGFPNLVSLQIPVQTGSRNEVEPGKSGFAHFFEHMMFRGTKAYPPDRYQAILTQAGARQNAYTTDDYTNYHITFAKEDLEKILEIEADRFQNLAYAEADFKTESRAVLGEYNKNSANPGNKLYEVLRDTAYTTHTYRHTTMGFLRDIEDMPNQFAYSREFFRRWYRPEYTTIIVAGDVEPDQVFPLIEKYWGQWPRGSFKVDIPQEPEPQGPRYAHVPWTTPTLPQLAIAFHGPAFSETDKDFAAIDLLLDLYFGPTSDLYRRLVERDQLVDQFGGYVPANADPSLITTVSRLKRGSDALVVRDAILETFALAKARPVEAKRLEESKSNTRYGLLRSLDNTERIAGLLARYVRYRRSFDSLNNYYRLIETLTPADLQAAANKYFTDNRLVVTSLSKDPLPAGIDKAPALAALAARAAGPAAADLRLIRQPSPLPVLNLKLAFDCGSVRDPVGKEGLATLAASMITEAGSEELRIDEINRAFFPMAASFGAQVDKDQTTFTAVVHKDNWEKFAGIALPQLLSPGFRTDDFQRLKEAQLNAIEQDLKANNDEDLGREWLQAVAFAGTRYAYPPLGTKAGLAAITLDDVKAFIQQNYTLAHLTVGLSGDASEAVIERLRRDLARLPQGAAPAAPVIAGRRPQGLEVEIVQKTTRATAISLGLPIEVTRSHPDFAALSVARAWLGEHRSSMSHLYQRIREVRGMNYGDYAYIEAFPYGGYSFFPPAGIPRRAQLFEIWIRPVAHENATMALRITLHELNKLIEKGLSAEDFEKTRTYLMKNVYLLTATQDLQLGYALDSRFYGIGDYASTMRERLAKLTVADVNKAIKKHFSAQDLYVVMVTQDAEGLKEKLVSDEPSTIKYEAPRPKDVLAEDQVIGKLKLHIPAAKIQIRPLDQVFAK